MKNQKYHTKQIDILETFCVDRLVLRTQDYVIYYAICSRWYQFDSNENNHYSFFSYGKNKMKALFNV